MFRNALPAVSATSLFVSAILQLLNGLLLKLKIFLLQIFVTAFRLSTSRLLFLNHKFTEVSLIVYKVVILNIEHSAVKLITFLEQHSN